MTFQLSTKPKEIRWKIEGREPDDKRPGEFKPFFFHATFIRRSKAEFDRIRADAEDDLAMVRAIMTGWELKGEDGQVIPFGDDARVREVLDVQYVAIAILTSYLRFLSGGAVAKN
jgi:hypothetical protein